MKFQHDRLSIRFRLSSSSGRIKNKRYTLIIALAAFACSFAGHAQQNYPVRPVRILVTVQPGVGADFIARVMAQKLGDAFKQIFVVESRSGRGAIIGADSVAKASGERISIFIDVARVEGPAANQREGEFVLSPCIQLGSFGSGTADEQEILEFYAQGRMPDMARLPGCVRMRKLISIAGWARQGCLYEFASLADSRRFHGHEKGDPKMEAWTDNLIRKFVHAPGTPTVAQRIWPPLK